MQPNLLRTSMPAASFALLFEAARAEDLRVGWLELGGLFEGPPTLEDAAAAGAFRAVGVGDRKTVAVKKRVGSPVLRDVVRQHFTGCRLVLVHGAVDAPEIAPDDEAWRISWATGVEKVMTTADIVKKMRRPRFP